MGRQKAHPPSSSMPDPEPPDQEPPLITTENPLQTNPLQIDLQLHKDNTNARFEDLRESIEFIKSQHAQLRAELLDEFKQMRLGSKTVAGHDISTSLRIDSIPSSSSEVRSKPATSVIGNFHSLGPLPDFHFVHPMIHQPNTSVVSSIGVPELNCSGSLASSVPLTFGSFHDNFFPKVRTQDSTSFSSNSVPTMGFGSSIPNYQLPPYGLPSSFPVSSCHSYKPFSYQNESIHTTRPTVYPQFQAYPYPTNYSGLSTYQFPDPTLGFSPHFQPHISIDPNLPTMKQMRLDFPIFGGGDPVEWLNKAEQYFMLYQIPDCKKVPIASMHLIDEAADVWHLFQAEYPGTWLGFSELIMKEFGGNTRIDYQAALAKMYQSGSVSDYKTQFNKLSRRASGFSREVLLACFVSGLKEEIRLDVRAHKPTNLLQAYELARIYEERHMGHKNIHRQQPTKIASPMGFTASMEYPHMSSSLPTHSTPRSGPLSSFSSSSNNRRQLSQAEYHDRRAKNLCFFCDEQYKPGHNCRKGHAFLIETIQTEHGSGLETGSSTVVADPFLVSNYGMN
ncbi:hypothetical protein M0R45_025158 [Rubus argutus]|uniref:Retrotransposon gag domain-containing protein n=1 Tax=Rubus argutus TaxID=59490 RepID=A0AAW1WVI3_RUBAR